MQEKFVVIKIKERELNMNKIIITTLLLCTGFITAACEKNYSVEDFKKDKNLLKEWRLKCGSTGTSKNCVNSRLAKKELETEERKKADENYEKALEEINKRREEREAKERAKAEQKERSH